MKRLLTPLLFLLAEPLLLFSSEPWTLEKAVDYALKNSPDASIAAERIASAKAALGEANSAFWPKLQAQSSYSRTNNPMLVFGDILNQRAYSSSLDFNSVPDVDDVNVRGMLTIPLYAGGRNLAGHRAAKAGEESARQSMEATKNLIRFEVTRAFITVQKARRFEIAAEATEAAFEKTVSDAKKRLDAGALLESDLLDVEVRLAQSRDDLIRAHNGSILASRALRNLLGIENGEFQVAENPPALLVPKRLDFSNRPELKAAAASIRAAQARLRAATSGYQPRVNAFGSLDYDHGPKYNSDGGSYTVGVVAQWDLWDGNLTTSKVRQARADLQSAREQERKLRLAIGLEVEQASLGLDAASKRLEVTEKSVEQASESEKLTRTRFQEGMALSTQLIDTEAALLAAKVRRAEAEADQQIAIAALKKALGSSGD